MPAGVWWRWEELNLRHGAYEACSGQQFRHTIMTMTCTDAHIAGGFSKTTTAVLAPTRGAAGTKAGTDGWARPTTTTMILPSRFRTNPTAASSGAPRLPATPHSGTARLAVCAI